MGLHPRGWCHPHSGRLSYVPWVQDWPSSPSVGLLPQCLAQAELGLLSTWPQAGVVWAGGLSRRDPALPLKLSSPCTVFICSFMVAAPIFGYLGDRFNRKVILSCGIFFWSAVTFSSSFIPQQVRPVPTSCPVTLRIPSVPPVGSQSDLSYFRQGVPAPLLKPQMVSSKCGGMRGGFGYFYKLALQTGTRGPVWHPDSS